MKKFLMMLALMVMVVGLSTAALACGGYKKDNQGFSSYQNNIEEAKSPNIQDYTPPAELEFEEPKPTNFWKSFLNFLGF